MAEGKLTRACPSVEDTKRLQAELGLRDRHVVYLDAEGFVIAHTDAERERGNLEDCDLHRWLLQADERPSTASEDGYYEAALAEPDDKSESSGFERWEFFPAGRAALEDARDRP